MSAPTDALRSITPMTDEEWAEYQGLLFAPGRHVSWPERKLSAEIARLRAHLRDTTANLTATQARCSFLLDETRAQRWFVAEERTHHVFGALVAAAYRLELKPEPIHAGTVHEALARADQTLTSSSQPAGSGREALLRAAAMLVHYAAQLEEHESAAAREDAQAHHDAAVRMHAPKRGGT